MMTILNGVSLLIILISLSIAVFHPKIKLPLHVDLIILLLAIGAAALFINTVLEGNLYGHQKHAEVWFRFGFALLTMRFVYQCRKGVKK